MSISLTTPTCSVCDQPGKPFYSLKRLERTVYRCPRCGFKWTCPPLHYDDSDSGSYYVEPPYARSLAVEEAKARTHIANIAKVVDLSSAPVKRLLEVGCSNGSLLAVLGGSGFSVEGLEISRSSLEECSRKGIKVHPVTFENFKTDQRFGVVLSAHVIEHLKDVHQYFHSASKLLVPGGLNVFLTPNGGSALFYLFRKFWAPATPDEHNIFLTPKAVALLAEKHGFDVVAVTNTGRYFSTFRGILAELYKVRRGKPKARLNTESPKQPPAAAAPGPRGKRDAVLKALGYLERPVLYPLHHLLTRLGWSDELLCVLRKKEKTSSQ